jgi:hypothetical protein
MTQKILTAMDSDDINDISDTEEALQVVDIIEDTYYELMSQSEWNHLKNPRQLTGLSDLSFPTTLMIPDAVMSLEDLRYEVREETTDRLDYKKLIYKYPDEFTKMVLSRDSTADNIETSTVKGAGTPLLILNDIAPTYWTSYDDTYVVLDSYNGDVENTVQGSKSLAYCVIMPDFDKTDNTFVPVCNIQMFPTLLAEAKRACFFYLKQQVSPIDDKRALRGTSNLKYKDSRAHEQIRRTRFGRK